VSTLRCSKCGESKDIEVRRFIDDDGKRKVIVTCDIIVHAQPVSSMYDDPDTPESSIGAGGDSLVHELKLYTKLVEVVYGFDGPVEYAVVEHELASAYPDDYHDLWERQGHATTSEGSGYTLSTYLASLLGTLAREQSVSQKDTDSTIPWSNSSSASAWAHPERIDGDVTSWAAHAEANGIDPETWPATAAFATASA
jgi:hypothetical protein